MFYFDKINEIESLVTVECQICQSEIVFKTFTAGLERWISGDLIQNSMPELPPAERELLISGTCGDCFEKLFPTIVSRRRANFQKDQN